MTRPERPQILLARGPRASERALFDLIEAHLQDSGTRVLERPLHLLVPSHSLRSHLLGQLVRERHRSVAGLRCWTLRGLAREILERAGEGTPVGGGLLPILVRRQASRHESLRDRLHHLDDGYGSLVGTITDLLEAGLEAAHGDALTEVLESEGPQVATRHEVQRASSLIRVAIEVQRQMESLGFGHVSSLLRRAAEILDTRSDLPLPGCRFLVHGFADATGVATDLIEAVLRRYGGAIILDRPADPIAPEREDPACEFSRRFSERIFALGSVERVTEETLASSRPTLLAALGAQAEVREIGWRIRRRLDAGVSPERIAVVSRQFESYVPALRTHFRRLGIPFSAMGTAGPRLAAGRQIGALLEILGRRERVRVERWLEAGHGGNDSAHVSDVRLALFGMGIGRLVELAHTGPAVFSQRESHPLPVRTGFAMDEDRDLEVSLPRRRIPSRVLEQAREDAVRACDLFTAWSRCHQWSDHMAKLRQLLSLLRWSPDEEPGRQAYPVLDSLAADLPEGLHIQLDEFVWLIVDALTPVGRDRLGGRGGGVQILDVTEARGRTFEHLFLMGLNKGVFPRTVREDPAFPDALRQTLGHEGYGVLPDLPRKRTGHVEERFLFAQLLSSSPDLTLSWQIADDDNKEVTPSPLVERLLWTQSSLQVRPVASLQHTTEQGPTPRTAYESAIRAALWGMPGELEGPFVAAVPTDQVPEAGAIIKARLRILEEFDRPAGPHSRLGPYFGFVGTTADEKDPRIAQPLFITTLERLAECPWRTFLERVLKVEALPDPVDILPGLDAVLVGRVVHRVLEGLVRRGSSQNPDSLADARGIKADPIRWPDRADLERRALHESNLVARDSGISWDGFAQVLAQVVVPYLDIARDLVWDESSDSLPVAAEMVCRLISDKATGNRELHFRVDRVDTAADGLRLVDYKTGRYAISAAKKQTTRDRHLLARIRQGSLLQAAAYAMAAGGDGDLGRYAFIAPDFNGPDETRILSIAAEDQDTREALETAIAKLLEAWDAGVFFPRLIEPDHDKEPGACGFCAAAEACLRGDSGARGRLRDWVTGRHQGNRGERALLEIWRMASNQKESRS